MDGVINFFTTEAGLFVRHLRFFSNIDNIHINKQIRDLLGEAICNIQELLNKADVIDNPFHQNIVDLIFGYDERQYMLRRFLECQSCCELIALSTDEFEAHSHSNHHNSAHHVCNSAFSPEPLSDTESVVCENKMATTDFSNTDCNQNYVQEQELTQNDEEIILPKYSEVISNSIPLDGGATSSSIDWNSSDDQSECLARDTSVDSGYGTTYLIKVRGLPWTTTKTDLCKFFRNVRISHDLDGIHFITDDENNVGVAYIQLPTRKDYDLAQSYHHKKLEERYIEVLKASKQDFVALGNIQKNSNDDYVLRLEGLPWNSKENEIQHFFHGLKIDAIRLILDKSTDYTLEAFVRFVTSDDYDLALKRNWEIMGNRHIKIFRSSEKYMSLRLKEQEECTKTKTKGKQTSAPNQGAIVALSVEKSAEKKTQKDEWQRVNSRRAKADGKKNTAHSFYMVLARGFPWKVTKQNIIDLFKGIKILNGEKGINIMKDGAMVAYVQLTSNADVKKALALDNKRIDSRTIHVTSINFAEYSRVASQILQTNDSRVVQIRGLPWSVDKAYIMRLFPAINIEKNQIQIEIDENNRRTGYAFVEFQTAEEYAAAFNTDFKAINQFIKLFQATKEQYLQTIISNNLMRSDFD